MPARTPEDEAKPDNFGKPPRDEENEGEDGRMSPEDVEREGKAFLDSLVGKPSRIDKFYHVGTNGNGKH